MTDVKRFYGSVQWRELMTTDVEKAKAFYGGLLPWKFKTEDMGGGFMYTLISVGEKQVGGLFAPPPGAPPITFWSSYVSVPDVDAACKAAKDKGGSVMKEPMDVPNVGRMGCIADPDGAVIWAYKASDEHSDNPPREPVTGEFCWETVISADLARAKAFYGAVFGWKAQDEPMPVFTIDGTQQGMVADFQKAEQSRPAWLTYVVVDKLADARDKVTQLGGSILMRQIDVPTVGSYAVVADPTGGVIGLFQSANRA